MNSVPLLDLSQNIEQIAVTCRKACEEHGFLYITNHRVNPEIVKAHADLQRNFFALPLEAKMSIAADDNNRGYTPLKDETLDPDNSTQGDNKEGLYFGREISADSPLASKPLHGPNQWPSETLIPGYRKIVEAYMSEMESLGMRMLRIVALALNLEPDHFLPYFHTPMIFHRPLRYAPIPSNEAEGRHAAGAHSDYGFMTFLWTDGTPGLQIFHKNNWIDVIPPVPDAYIVNLGDMLERWTAGKFKSTLHRVVNPLGVERLSCAFFFEPSFDAEVAPLPGCAEDAEKALEEYPAITSGQYLLDKYAVTHAGYKQKIDEGVAKTS